MIAPSGGVTFREVMKGSFAQRAADPAEGARAGRQAGTTLALQVVATIPDARRFVDDPHHEGVLGGSVTFDPIGRDMPIVRGTFQLFAPGADDDLKLMIYRAVFEHAGTTYCLEGAKHVRRRSIVRSWTDTTTLYCRLHDGRDASAPVVAAGILRIGAGAFARQLLSFRTVNAPSVVDKWKGLAAFFTFFGRELVDTYVWRGRRTPSRAGDVRS